MKPGPSLWFEVIVEEYTYRAVLHGSRVTLTASYQNEEHVLDEVEWSPIKGFSRKPLSIPCEAAEAISRKLIRLGRSKLSKAEVSRTLTTVGRYLS